MADHHEDALGKPRPEVTVSGPAGKDFDAWFLQLPWERNPKADEPAVDVWTGFPIGDERFDACFRLGSLEAGALAPLDAATRDLLLGVRKRRETFRLVNGRLLLLLPPGTLTPERLAAGVDAAVAFAQRLAAIAADVPAALARNAREDRSPAVRLKNLEELAEHFPTVPVTRETLGALRGDPEPDVRLLAAILSRDQGFETLVASLRAPHLDGDLLLRALVHLVTSFGSERTRPVIASILDGGPDSLREGALLAIREAGSPAWEDLAIGALALEAPEVRRAAIGALARIGTKASIPPLRAIERDEPLDLLQNAATVAAAQIRERLTDAAAGQIALADDGGAGRLSLADGSRAGRIALPGDGA
jgi:hypothetical protein